MHRPPPDDPFLVLLIEIHQDLSHLSAGSVALRLQARAGSVDDAAGHAADKGVVHCTDGGPCGNRALSLMQGAQVYIARANDGGVGVARHARR